MKSYILTKNLKIYLAIEIGIWMLFFLYPSVISLGYISFFVYLTQFIIGLMAFSSSYLEFNENFVEEYGPTYDKDKTFVIFGMILLLVLSQFPIVAYLAYPSEPDDFSKDYFIRYKNQPSTIAIVYDVLMSIAIIYGIDFVNSEYKDPNELMTEYLKKQEQHKQRELEAQKEKNRKIELYGDNYISLCARVVFSSDKNRMWINEIEYTPSEIISVDVDDISTKTQLPQEIKTKTSTGSMIGRGVVGGLLLGTAGAIIGGSTAKKKSIITEGKIITNYRYKLRISTTKSGNELINYESTNLDSIRKCQSFILGFVRRNINNSN